MRAQISLCLLLGLLPAAGAAHAQGTPPAPAASPGAIVAPRAYVSANGGYQATSNVFSDGWSYDYFADRATVSAHYPVKAGFLFEAGGGVRIWRNLMVGAAVSRFSRTDTVSVTASVPHPFFYEMRSVEGTDSGLGRTETALHVQAMWVLAASPTVQVGLFGGPSVFSVRQGLVTKPNFNEVYPYDTVTMTGVTTGQQSKSAIGYHVGADITYLLSPTLGVGVLIRLSRAKVNFQSPDNTVLGVNAGGAQVGGGIRVRF